MKKLAIALCFALISSISHATLYEDAEDGNTNGWRVYDNTPAGAIISNVYDDNKQSNVIELSGDGWRNGYVLRKSSDGTAWNNTEETIIQWSMNYNEYFTVYISAQTTKGHRYIYYTPSNSDGGLRSNGRYIHHGLGSSSVNGEWQTFTRDLQADLKEFESDNEIISINAFLIRGNGKVDDIEMLKKAEVHSIKKTRQTISYINFDDGYYQKGVAQNYTRDDNTEVVTDHVTGLMWQDNSDVLSLEMPWEDSISYCENYNPDGYENWRLPNVQELLSISDSHDGMSPVFQNTNTSLDPYSGAYWASKLYLGGTSSNWAWFVNTRKTVTWLSPSGSNMNVRCVRGDAFISTIYERDNNGIVTDLKRDLQWQDDYSDNNGSIKYASWSGNATEDGALEYCENLTLGGLNDWRLPNKNELFSLIDYDQLRPEIYPEFQNSAYYYWSSSTIEDDTDYATMAYTSGGYTTNANKNASLAVRCIRD